MPFTLKCPKCAKEVLSACECGVAYLPKSELAAMAIKQNPVMSDRAIAEAINTNNSTVSRMRNQLLQNATVESRSVSAQRVGLDGRVRAMPRVKRQTPAAVAVPKPTQQQTAIQTRASPLEQRIERLEKLYRRIIEIRRTGCMSHEFCRSMKALLLQPENVSEAKRHQLREQWDVYVWLLASEQVLPTPSLTDAGIPTKEKVK